MPSLAYKTLFTLLFLWFLALILAASPLLSISQSTPTFNDPILSQSKGQVEIPPNGDHPEWGYLNGKPWDQMYPGEQDQIRLHSYLAMSMWGDYRTNCAKTFTKGFFVIEEFGMGYTAVIPEMRKVILVFNGISFDDYAKLDWTPVSIDEFVVGCNGCQAAKSVVDEYLRIDAVTKNFAIAKKALVPNKAIFSVTGLGFGGMLAALTGLILGAANYVHYSHNIGTARFMNHEAVLRYDNIFQVSSHSVVANNDFFVQTVPLGVYYHIGQKIHIYGKKTENLINCFGWNENSTCLGDGSSKDDHLYYFTPLGSCGSVDKAF